MKHSNPNRPIDPLVYHQYSENSRLCIVNCLKSLLKNSKDASVTRSERTLNQLWKDTQTINDRHSPKMDKR